jgi:hypothetical protein
MVYSVAQALPQQQQQAQPSPSATTSPNGDTPATALPQAEPTAMPAGSLTTLKPATATALKPTFDKLDAVLAKYGPKAGLKAAGAPADHYARVQLADQVFKGLASKPAEQKAFLQEMAKAGEAFGINCGLSVPDTAAKLASPAKAIQSELVGVFLNQKQTHVKAETKAETKADDSAPQAQTTSSTTGSSQASAPDAAKVKEHIKELFSACGIPPTGAIKAKDIGDLIDKVKPNDPEGKIAKQLKPYQELFEGSSASMTVDQLTAAAMKKLSAPEPETNAPTTAKPEDQQPIG